MLPMPSCLADGPVFGTLRYDTPFPDTPFPSASPAESSHTHGGGRGSVSSDRVTSDARLSTFGDGPHRRTLSREPTSFREIGAAGGRSSNGSERDSSSEGFQSSDEGEDEDDDVSGAIARQFTSPKIVWWNRYEYTVLHKCLPRAVEPFRGDGILI